MNTNENLPDENFTPASCKTNVICRLYPGQKVVIKQRNEIIEPQFIQVWRDEFYGKEVTVRRSWVDEVAQQEYFSIEESDNNNEWSIIDVVGINGI